MKKTYVTFKREMARAYAESRKRMTRRVMKPQLPEWANDCKWDEYNRLWLYEVSMHNRIYDRLFGKKLICPYGQPGDQLILGTTWAVPKEYDHLKPSELPVGHLYGVAVFTFGLCVDFKPIKIWSYFDGDEKPEGFGKLRPARFLPNKLRDRMPRETLRIVKAERVQDITNYGAIREGIFETPRDPGFDCWSTYGMRDYYPTPRDAFRALWDSINAGRNFSWESNPWIWCIGW
jgi:hypothetical protein